MEETEIKLSALRLENARLIDNNNLSFKYSQDESECQGLSRSFLRLSSNQTGKPSISRKTNFKNEFPSNTRFSSIFKPRISTLNNYRKSIVTEGENNGNSIFKPRISNLNNSKISNALEGGEIGNVNLFYSKSNILENNFELWKGNFEQIDDITIIGIRV